ncbi:MAG: 50S ribosomal protein L17 [Candidatus Magasanikbacteria bacterium]|nr:50S ribosomal protein L17 [Candidatus Magasanikbacteria bacterium]
MRHKKKGVKLGRERGQRKALLRSLAESLVLHGAVTTTLAKAKALRTVVEPLITRAKGNTQLDRDMAMGVLFTGRAVSKLFKDIAPRYAERKGGYTRITKLGYRENDSAETAKIEFV